MDANVSSTLLAYFTEHMLVKVYTGKGPGKWFQSACKKEISRCEHHRTLRKIFLSARSASWCAPRRRLAHWWDQSPACLWRGRPGVSADLFGSAWVRPCRRSNVLPPAQQILGVPFLRKAESPWVWVPWPQRDRTEREFVAPALLATRFRCLCPLWLLSGPHLAAFVRISNFSVTIPSIVFVLDAISIQPGTPLARGEWKRWAGCGRCVSGRWRVGSCWFLLSSAFTHLAQRHTVGELPRSCPMEQQKGARWEFSVAVRQRYSILSNPLAFTEKW